VHRERQFLRLCRHTLIMRRQHQRRGTVGENQHWNKEIVVHWEGQSQKYCSTGDSRTKSTKTVRREFHKPNIHGRAATPKPLITESNAQTRKRWCHDHKTWTSDNRKRARDMVRWVVLHAVLYVRKSLRFREHPKKPTVRNAWFGSNSETRGRFSDGLGSNIVVKYSLGTIITLHGRITAREYVDRLGNQVHPMIQTLFPNNDAVFQDDSWNCSVVVWRPWFR
jgi:hypothetical protein